MHPEYPPIAEGIRQVNFISSDDGWSRNFSLKDI